MMRLFLIIVALILVPPALSYGVDPAAMLPKTMDITVQGTDQTEMLRAIMGLYFGMSAFCLIAAFKPEWRHVAMVWAVFFLYSMGLGRLLSLVVDGIPSRILLFYMAVELTGGTIGLAILARERRKAQARR
ncbi:MAG: DUF4345 domain-containing protein [Methyloceanibacter sp.]|jgi:hypothetical protein